MSTVISVKPSSFTGYALRDIARGEYYDREKGGLGDKFIKRVYEPFDRIVAKPEG